MRTAFYARLAPLARRWSERLRRPLQFPDELEAFRALCAASGQTRPTPLLLRYGPGGYKFNDFLKAGIPLTVVTGVIVVFLAQTIWPE